jgi:hypothetical protein
MCMSSHVGTIVIGGLSSEKEVVVVELGGQPHEVSRMLTFSSDQCKPRCIQYLYKCNIQLFYFKCM